MDGARQRVQPDPRLARARRALSALGARIRGLAIARLLLLGGAIGLSAVLLAAAGDYLIRFPSAMRIAQLLVWLGVIAWATTRWLLPTVRFRPSMTQLALRVENADPELRGSLASALELSDARASGPTASELTDRLVDRIARVFDPARAGSLVDTAPVKRAAAWLALPLAVSVIALSLSPSLAATGAARVLTPWSDAAWPKRTQLADATSPDAHPAGVALPLRAALVRTHRDIGETPVRVNHRVRRADGSLGPTRGVWLTSQGRTVESGDERGELYETLLETGAFFTHASEDGPASLEYWFETEDDRTDTSRVMIVPPPALERARLVVTPPAYARGTVDDRWQEGERDLGAGMDERSVVGPVLAGSRAVLTIETSKPLGDVEDAVSIALEDGTALEARVTDDPLVWEASWIARDAETLRVSLIDGYGIESRERPAFRVEVLADEPASATVLVPDRDESVLATASIPIEVEGRDDVGLGRVAIELQPMRKLGDSEGAAPEPDGEPLVLAESSPEEATTGTHRVQSVLELSELGLKPGEEVHVFAVAADLFADADGVGRDATRSTARVLRIIGESELIDEVLAELGAVRRGAIRLDSEQESLERRLERRPATRADAREQSSVREGVSALREIIENVGERLDRNDLNDEIMRGLLEDAQATARAAEASAARAAEKTQESADAETERERADAEEDAAVERERVRDELERLAGLLDRGQDSWAVRRSLERLLEAQAETTEQTERAGAITQGRDLASLSPEELSELDKIAQRQFELAEQASDLLDDLERRAEQMDELDPGQAEAMRAAARRGRDAQVARQLEQAGEQIEQNQTSQAGQSQQSASEALSEMVRDLDDAARQRDAELQRMLASLIESLEGLIRQQNQELRSLESARASGETGNLAAGMGALHRNTLGVLDDVAQELAALSEVRGQVRIAADAQGRATRHLRELPQLLNDAEEAERASLESLESAKSLAEEAQREAENREAQRAREELRQRYESLLEEQVALRAETEPLVGEELTRRTRATARGLGQRQEMIRDRIEAMRTEFPDVGESALFSLAHDRLGLVTDRSAQTLRGGEAPRRVTLDQASAIRLLQGLIDALDEQQQDEDFRDANGGGEGGEGQAGEQPQPVIPPIAELKALRMLQQEALELTKLAGDGLEGADINEAGALQLEVAERGLKALEELEQSGGPAPTPPAEEPPSEEPAKDTEPVERPEGEL